MKLKTILFKDSIIYGSAAYLNIITGIVLTPIYTRMIEKSHYGIMEVFLTWNAYFTVLLPLGVTTGLVRFYPDYKENPAQRKLLVGSVFHICIGSCLVFLTFGYLFKDQFLGIYFHDNSVNQQQIYLLSLVMVVQMVMMSISQSILVIQRRSAVYAVISISNFLLMTGGGFFFVYYLRQDILGFYRASAISTSISFIAGFIAVRKELAWAWSRKMAKDLLRFSIPFVFTNSFFYVNDIFDRTVIIRVMDEAHLGAYSLALKIAGMGRVVYTAFQTSYYPFAVSIAEKPWAKEVYALVHKVFVAISCIVLTAGLLFRREAILFFAPAYPEVYNTIIILLACNVIMGGITVYSIGLHITRKTGYIVNSIIVTSIVNTVVTLPLAYYVGLDGVAWGSLAASMAWVGSQMYYSNKHFPLTFDKVIVLKMLAYIAVMTVIGNYFRDVVFGQWYFDLGVKALIFLGTGIPIGLYVWKYLKTFDRNNEENLQSA